MGLQNEHSTSFSLFFPLLPKLILRSIIFFSTRDMQRTAQTFLGVYECKLITTLTLQLGTQMHKVCRRRELTCYDHGEQKEAFCNFLCTLAVKISKHCSAHGFSRVPGRTRRAWLSTEMSAWLLPKRHSWLTPNCHKNYR